MEESEQLIVLKFVVMERDSNINVMMEIKKMETGAIKIVRLKNHGLA